jgi:hypothetical protein
MPLGVTLLELRRELRAETGTSLNPNQGVQAQDTLDIILARQQRELWDAYTWQHLQLWVDMPLSEGQATYSYPASMAFDQIKRILIADSAAGQWNKLAYGIQAHMVHGAPPRGTPKRWRNVATVDVSTGTPVTNPVGQLELLPVPSSSDMVLRFDGQAPLSPLIAPTDTCIIDSKCIVLFAAAEIMATQKSEAAPMKLTKAQNYLRRLLADQGADKRQNYNMGGNQRGGVDPDKMTRRVPYVDFIPY